MNKKKTILAAVVLLLVFVVGGAIAYFTDTDTKTNTFTIGNVDITLTEPAWTELNSTTDANDNDIPDAAEDMMPGETVAKDPTINNVSTKNPAYVFMKVEIPCSKTVTTTGATSTTLNPTELFTYTTNTEWTELSSAAVACTDSGTATHVYYYGTSGSLTPLAKAANASTPTSTPALFTQVTLLGTLIPDQIPETPANKDVIVTGYGIQTEGLESTTPADVWGYLNN